MNQRLISSFVSLLYVSIALVFGSFHHHHHATAHTDGHDDDCAACQWHLLAKSDVPVGAVVPVIQPAVICAILIPANEPVVAPFFSSTASRAPPVTSA